MTIKYNKKRPLKVEFSARNISSYGGLELIKRFYEKIRFESIIQEKLLLKRSRIRYQFSDLILEFHLGLFLGAETLRNCFLFTKDEIVKTIFDKEVFAHNSTLSRFFKLFTKETIDNLREINQTFFRKLLRAEKKHWSKVTIDLDSTVLTVYGNQEKASKGYNPDKRGRKSYHPIVAFLGETRDFIAGHLRPGNVYTSHKSIEFLKEVLIKLPPSSLRFLRADSGFFDDKFLSFCEARKIHYALCAKLYQPLKARIETIEDFRPFDNGSEIAEFYYSLNNWSTRRKFIVTRSPIATEDNLFGFQAYHYRVIVTNIYGTPESIFRFSNKRCNIENLIKEVKSGFNLGHILTSSFYANEAVFQLTMLAYNLYNRFKRLLFTGKSRYMTVHTFRLRFIYVCVQLVKTGGKRVLKFPISYPFQSRFLDICTRIPRLSIA